MGWKIYDTVGGEYYSITEEKLVRQLSGLNYVTCKIDGSIANDTLVYVIDSYGIRIFTGFIKKTADPTDDIRNYEISERATELEKELTDASPLGAGTYAFTAASMTVNAILDDLILYNSGWTRGSSDTTSLTETYFYYESRLDGLFRVLQTYRDHYVWFDNDNKVVYFGSSRTDRTASNVAYISNLDEVDSSNRVYDQIIVIGSNDSIIGTAGSPGGTTKCYQYNNIQSSYEAQQVCDRLYADMGASNKTRVTCVLSPVSLYYEGDLVSVNDTNYVVHNVEMTSEYTKLVCNSKTTTISDIFMEDKLRPSYNSATSGGTGVTDHSVLSNLDWASAGHTINDDIDMNANDIIDVGNIDFYATGYDGRIYWTEHPEAGNWFEFLVKDTLDYASIGVNEVYASYFHLYGGNLWIYGDDIIGCDSIRGNVLSTFTIQSYNGSLYINELTFDYGSDILVGNDMSFQNTYYIHNLMDPTLAQDAATKAYVDAHSGLGNIIEDTTPQLGGNLDCNGKYLTDFNVYNGGNKIIGGDNTIPYFPYGIILGTTVAGTETISFNSGIMYFASNTSFAFDGGNVDFNSGDLVDVSSVIAPSSTDLTFTVDSGQAFVFEAV